MDIKVSAIVPVYNTEKFLEKCIRSIMSQTLKEIEIICINDGSTDNSLEILKKLQKEDKRIIIIDKKNEGASKARNIGIEEARGNFLCFIDGDDWIEKDMLEKMYLEAKKKKLDLVITGVKVIKGDRVIKKDNNDELLDEKIYTGNEYLELIIKGSSCVVWNKLIKRKIIIENNIKFNEKIFFNEDYNFICKLSEKIKKVKKLEGLYYCYRIGENNGSSKAKEKYLIDIILCYEELKNTVKDSYKNLLLDRRFSVELGNKLINFNYIKLNNYEIYLKKYLKFLKDKRIKFIKFSEFSFISKKKKIILNLLILFCRFFYFNIKIDKEKKKYKNI